MRMGCCSVWPGPATIASESSEDVFTYSMAPKFKFNDRMAFYARVAKGFRPGGPNVIAPDSPDVPTTYESDTTLNYELGLKGENEARTFALTWLPSISIGTTSSCWPRSRTWASTRTRARADSEGVEVSLMFLPVERLKLSLSGAYTDAKLTEDADLLLVGGREGDRLPYTPKTSYSASADYEWPLAEIAARISALRSVTCETVPGRLGSGLCRR